MDAIKIVVPIVFVISICWAFYAYPMDRDLFQRLIQSEKSPQQILAEQIIDDTHDAFLVDTFGELGTLLVTVAWDKENVPYDEKTLLHFTIWDLHQMDEPLQTMVAYTSVFHTSKVVDANFDGYQDFGYQYILSNQPNYWHFWIWDEKKKCFVEEKAFDDISDPTFDQETQTINGWARSSAMGTGMATIHQWVAGKLICMRRINVAWDGQNERIDVMVEDFINDTFLTVYHQTFPPDARERLEAVTKWQDLAYHGEMMEENG